MTIELGNKLTQNTETFELAKKNYKELSLNGGSEEAISNAYDEMINELYKGVVEEAKANARQEAMKAVDVERSRLDGDQYKFFNQINTEVGYKEEKLLPETTINKIYEDLEQSHPLLDAIGLFNAGPRVKFIRAETSGTIVWGKIFGEIKGQLDATFSDEVAIQSKATAFVVVPKDLKDLSVDWIERFVRLQITEAFAFGLELAFLSGDGNDKPIGLDRDINKGNVFGEVTTYPAKDPAGTLTIDPLATDKTNLKALSAIKRYHSVKENGKPLNTQGRLILVVSPEDNVDLEVAFTTLTPNGTYVNSTPFNIQIIESKEKESGTVLSFVKGRYDAAIGGGVTIRKYDQTLAMEDMDLYTAKQFVYGKAADNKAAALWTLDIKSGETSV